MEICDCMALMIRFLLEKRFDPDTAGAMASEGRDNMAEEIDELLAENSFSLTDPVAFLEACSEKPMLVFAVLQMLDEGIPRLLENELWNKKLDFVSYRCIDSLNSQDNRDKTNIIILPRYDCIWVGKSREENHRIDINTYLHHSYFIETVGGMVEGKYLIKNYILNPQRFGLCMNAKNELFLQMAVSPLTAAVKLKDIKYCQVDTKTNYFMIKEHDQETQDMLAENIEKVMREADENGDKILLFPEMLGTDKMKQIIARSIRKKHFQNIQFMVFPSIWERNGEYKNRNISYVLDYEGNEWFGQDKLRRFPWKQKQETFLEDIKAQETFLEDIKAQETFLEDIIEGTEIHIIHCENYGSIAIAVCRSELDEDIRDLIIRKLNVKLILCPSWTQGSHEFECSIMTGIERTCNVAWCNTCSALDSSQGEKTVGIITSFGKNRHYSKMTLEGCKFPEGGCNLKCGEGCLFSGKIYGTDYKETQIEEDENYEQGIQYIDVIWSEKGDI